MAPLLTLILLLFSVNVTAFVGRKPVLLNSHNTPLQQLAASTSSSDGPASSSPVFPVLSRIAGIEWSGECRYVGSDLTPASNLELVGGLRYDIDVDGTSSFCTLSSYLTFPNGKRREVVMNNQNDIDQSSGSSCSNNSRPATQMRLESTAKEVGPIYMIVTELPPDTVLINEIETATGNIVMTSSLSIIASSKKVGAVDELVQISHEVGDGSNTIEGHQVWRLKKAASPAIIEDFDTREKTGR